MARSSAIRLARWLLQVTVPVLALLASGCFSPIEPRRQPPAAAAIEQTAPDGLTFARGNASSRDAHFQRLGLARWHEQGYCGHGVKIAILDSGFRGYRAFLGKGLPALVKTRSFRQDQDLEARDSQHGILCAEIVHALAPGADLLFANWEPDRPRSFLDAVRWARAEGARILSCSLIMPGWSDGEGGGAVHDAFGALLGAGDRPSDLLCFASAGNTAQRHWAGAYSPDAHGRHQWSPGQTRNTVVPWGAERIAVELYGPAHTRYALEVLDGSGRVVGAAEVGADAAYRGRAIVRFDPDPRASYAIRLSGDGVVSGTKRFHLVVLGGNLEIATARGSIAFPGDGAQVTAVGAVDVLGRRVSYSSCGPNSPLPKPDFVAMVPFQSVCRDRPFAGTSAAAPQAAGVAAVLLARRPEWAPQQVRAALRAAAEDLAAPGHDSETGYGLIRLP